MKKPFKILLIDLGSSRAEINEPIGICSLYTYLKKYLTEPVDIQLKFFPNSQFPTKEDITKYDVVGLSTKIGCLNKIASIYSLLQQIPSNQRPLLVLGDLINCHI